MVRDAHAVSIEDYDGPRRQRQELKMEVSLPQATTPNTSATEEEYFERTTTAFGETPNAVYLRTGVG